MKNFKENQGKKMQEKKMQEKKVPAEGRDNLNLFSKGDAHYIPPPNFTQIPNVVFDYWLPRLKPSSGIILLILCRKIFGWHKTSDQISVNQLCRCSGMSKNTVIGALNELQEHRLIKKIQYRDEFGCKPNTFMLTVIKPLDSIYSSEDNPHENTEDNDPDFDENGNGNSGRSSKNLGGGSAKFEPGVVQNLNQGVVQNLHPQKKDLTKERLTKEYAPPKGDAPTRPASPKKIERAPNVQTTDQEHAKLIEKYGPEVVEQSYQELALWKESASAAQVKKHSSDYLRITKWVALSVIEQTHKENKLINIKPVENKRDKVEKNRSIALERLSGLNPNIARCMENFVEFRIQGRANQLFYDANGFEEQLKNALYKSNPNPLTHLIKGAA